MVYIVVTYHYVPGIDQPFSKRYQITGQSPEHARQKLQRQVDQEDLKVAEGTRIFSVRRYDGDLGTTVGPNLVDELSTVVLERQRSAEA